MKFLFFVLTFFLPLFLQAQGVVCESLFSKVGVKNHEVSVTTSKNYQAFLSEDQHFLKIVNLKTKTEYTYDSHDILNGFFSLDGHAWIIPGFNEIQIWNFERREGNLLHIKLRHAESFPMTSMHKDPANGHTILKIIYRREKINISTRRFEMITETILKDLETLEESRI
jgi:hypothetical protein